MEDPHCIWMVPDHDLELQNEYKWKSKVSIRIHHCLFPDKGCNMPSDPAVIPADMMDCNPRISQNNPHFSLGCFCRQVLCVPQVTNIGYKSK